jgi:hypothetical protein
MRTYDPADRIRYVHLASTAAGPPHAHEECHRLPPGYANASLRSRLGEPRAAGARPALVVLPGGGSAAAGPSPAAPALRVAR